MKGRINRKNIRGMTLVEVMISTVILGYLLYMIYASFTPAIRQMRIADAQTQTQQSAIVAYQKLFNLISETNPRSITITDAPSSLYTKSISFLSHQALSITGTSPIPEGHLRNQHTISDGVQWQKFVIIYPGKYTTSDREIPVLFMKEIPYPSVSHPFGQAQVYRIHEDHVQSYINTSSYPAMVLTVDIDDVEFSFPRYPAVLIELQCSRRTGIQRVRRAEDKFRPDDYTYAEGERFLFSVFPRN